MLNYQRVTDIGLMMCIDYFQFEKYWVCFFSFNVSWYLRDVYWCFDIEYVAND